MNDKMNSRCVCKGAAVLACIKLCNYLPWSMDIIEWTDSWNILAWAGIKSKQLESDFNVFFSFKKCCALRCNLVQEICYFQWYLIWWWNILQYAFCTIFRRFSQRSCAQYRFLVSGSWLAPPFSLSLCVNLLVAIFIFRIKKWTCL